MKTKRRVVVATAIAVVALVAPAAGQGSSAALPPLVWVHASVVVTSYNYGPIAVGNSSPATFYLKNRSMYRTGVLTINLTSPVFSKISDACSGKRLAPMTKCKVTVFYSPNAAGSDNATLAASRLSKPDVNLGLSGSGTGGGGGGAEFGSVYWANWATGAFPGSVNTIPSGSSSVTSLAVNQHYPDAIAVYGTNVYWLNRGTTACPNAPYCGDGSLNAIPLAGGVPTTLASGLDEPNSLAVDGTNVYWTDAQDGTVKAVPLAGGTVTTLATGQNGPGSVAVNGTHVYWVDSGDPNLANGSVNEVPLGGGSVTALATGQHLPFALALDGTNVYWTETQAGNVNKIPLGGGSVTTISGHWVGLRSLAVDSTSVYFTSTNGSSTTGTINAVPLGGGNVTILANGQTYPSSVVVDGTYAYWVDDAGQYGNGTVNAVPLAGGSVTVLASGQGSPQSVAVGP